MSQKRAFEDVGQDDEDGGKIPSVAADLDAYQQFTLPNGNLLVIGEGQDLDTKLGRDDTESSGEPPDGIPQTPPEWNDAIPFDTESDIAESVKDAEAALAHHVFGDHELTFQDVFEHDELSTRVDEPYSANGMEIQEDDASYRETSSSDWTQKFTVDVPAEYEGRLKFTGEYKVDGDGYAHLRLLHDGEVVDSVHTDSEDYIEYSFETETVGVDESEVFKFEIRAVDASTDGNSGVTTRVRGLSGEPEFSHEGETYWLSQVSRKAMPEQDFKNRVGL